MTNDAIIGHSGFVGGTLVNKHPFGGKFNSSNIDTISNSTFDTVVCAAAPGSMFIANRYPDRDRAAIDILIDQLSKVRAQRFVLISSIAVLANFAAGVDERTHSFEQDHAYGHHRRLLETFCESHFDNCLIVRLPALFGPGLKKNFLFDLMNPVPSMMPEARLNELLGQMKPDLRRALADLYTLDADTDMFHLNRIKLNSDARRSTLDTAVRAVKMSATQFHHPDSTYQYYDIERLWHDIETATKAGLSSVHLAVAPLRAADIHTHLLGIKMPATGARLHHEDMRTCHAEQWRREGPYLEDAATVLSKLSAFFSDEQYSS